MFYATYIVIRIECKMDNCLPILIWAIERQLSIFRLQTKTGITVVWFYCIINQSKDGVNKVFVSVYMHFVLAIDRN